MKKITLLFVCFLMCFLRVYSQNITPEELSQFKKNPELSVLYDSALHYVLLYENDVDSLTKALEYIDKAISINPDISYTHIWKGEILFRIGKKEESLNLFSSLCEKKDCSYNTIFLTGMLYEKTGNEKKALEYYNRALNKNTAILNSTVSNLKDFMYNIAIRYFIDGKILNINEVKSLLPDNLKGIDEEVIKADINKLYKEFDKENYIKNIWNYEKVHD